MRDRLCYKGICCYAIVTFTVAGSFLFPSVTQAVSLGGIEVASPLNETFDAEVPLQLEGNELASKVFVEIASASDYKVFEVYRDAVLDSIRADVASDERGVRVKLSSRVTVQSPFFNLVLKIRYGRVSHFKKYSVFLDSSKAVQRVIEMKPQPEVKSLASEKSIADEKSTLSSKLTESAGKVSVSNNDLLLTQKVITNQADHWARLKKYGPIVRGDSLSVVAQRLRLDQRYTINQVMVALFEKNPSSFDKDNMNLIKAGRFLDVPDAQEVELRSNNEAYNFFAEHEQAWKQRPRYSAEVEMQRNRYSKRVSMGNQADARPIVSITGDRQDVIQSVMKPVLITQQSPSVLAADVLGKIEGQISPHLKKMIKVQSETNKLLAALQLKNDELQQQLLANKNSVDVFNQRVDEGALEASNASLEKLEILLIRLQAKLDDQAGSASMKPSTDSEWVTWILLSLVLVLLAIIAVSLRREPVHPGSEQALVMADEQPDEATDVQADSKNDAPIAPEVEPQVESLEDLVKGEVDNIEIQQQPVTPTRETATLDFTDELSDTDTAELEPFDASAKQELDPSVDYLSEADVYIRYGMDEEALQQLEMALRLQPDHVEAHIKKSELLHKIKDKPAYAKAVAAATAILMAMELEQYHTAVQAFGGGIDADVVTAIDNPLLQTTSPLTVAIEDTDLADLDLADLSGMAELEMNTSDLSPGISDDDGPAEVENLDSEASIDGAMDWLSDPAFDNAEDMQFSEPDQIEDDMQSPDDIEAMSNSTQELGSLLDEFSTDDASTGLIMDMSDQSGNALDILTDELEPQIAIQELGDLLSEFAEPEKDPAEDRALDLPTVSDFDAGATQHLDSLLSEFSDDESFNFANETNDIAPSVAPDSKPDSKPDSVDYLDISAVDSTDLEEDYLGATQELDHLLSEFSDEVDGLSFVDSNESTAGDHQNAIANLEVDHGATQELDGLLGEFIDVNDPDDKKEVDHGATQELDSLLGEFIDVNDPNDKKEMDHGATQVLGHLLDEFIEHDKGDKKS